MFKLCTRVATASAMVPVDIRSNMTAPFSVTNDAHQTGLATAACLGRVGVRVTVALGEEENSKVKAAGTGSSRIGGPDPAVGIWTHGLKCLDQLGILGQLEAEGR